MYVCVRVFYVPWDPLNKLLCSISRKNAEMLQCLDLVRALNQVHFLFMGGWTYNWEGAHILEGLVNQSSCYAEVNVPCHPAITGVLKIGA